MSDVSSKTAVSRQPTDPGTSLSMRLMWYFSLLFAVAGIFFAAQIIAGIIVGAVLAAQGNSVEQVSDLIMTNGWAQFATIIIVEIITVAGVYLALRSVNRPFQVLGWARLKSIELLELVGFFIGYFAVSIGITALVANFIKSIDAEQSQQIGFDGAVGFELVPVFVALCIAVPIAEEVIFRGLLYKGGKRLIGRIPSSIITSVIFGLAHLELGSGSPPNWIAAIDTAVFSIVLIYVYDKYKTLWAPIMLHMLKNSLAFVFLFIVKG